MSTDEKQVTINIGKLIDSVHVIIVPISEAEEVRIRENLDGLIPALEEKILSAISRELKLSGEFAQRVNHLVDIFHQEHPEAKQVQKDV